MAKYSTFLEGCFIIAASSKECGESPHILNFFMYFGGVHSPFWLSLYKYKI